VDLAAAGAGVERTSHLSHAGQLPGVVAESVFLTLEAA